MPFYFECASYLDRYIYTYIYTHICLYIYKVEINRIYVCVCIYILVISILTSDFSLCILMWWWIYLDIFAEIFQSLLIDRLRQPIHFYGNYSFCTSYTFLWKLCWDNLYISMEIILFCTSPLQNIFFLLLATHSSPFQVFILVNSKCWY